MRPAKTLKNRPAVEVMQEEGRRLLECLEPRDCVWALDLAASPGPRNNGPRR
ncbi:hypothetical protein DFAR_3190013 [Desulfarculales bacterium]